MLTKCSTESKSVSNRRPAVWASAVWDGQVTSQEVPRYTTLPKNRFAKALTARDVSTMDASDVLVHCLHCYYDAQDLLAICLCCDYPIFVLLPGLGGAHYSPQMPIPAADVPSQDVLASKNICGRFMTLWVCHALTVCIDHEVLFN